MQDQGLDWGKCVWLCIDRAASMILMLNAKIKKVANKKLLSRHCIYRCKHIAGQKLSPESNDIMIRPVKIINYS